MIERLVLVEALHLDGPLNRLPLPPECELAVSLARDRYDSPVNGGRMGAIDCDLGFAGRLAPFKGREIEERKADCALDLQGSSSGKKDHGGVGIDAFDGLAGVVGRIAQESDHRLLRGFCHHCAAPSILTIVTRVNNEGLIQINTAGAICGMIVCIIVIKEIRP